jgi:hypothetical protein
MNNFIKSMSLLIMIATSGTVLADAGVLRLYTDRESGDTKYYVINTSNIKYLEWNEDDSLMKVFTGNSKHGESQFLIPIKSNKDAEKFIEILMGQKTDSWLNADHQ